MDQIEKMNFFDQQQVINPRTGKIERVFVKLEAVYPNPDNPNEEMSFEELRAKARGWLQRDWAAENKLKKQNEQQVKTKPPESTEYMATDHGENSPSHLNSDMRIENMVDESQVLKNERPKKMKIMEVKAEVQTSNNICSQIFDFLLKFA